MRDQHPHSLLLIKLHKQHRLILHRREEIMFRHQLKHLRSPQPDVIRESFGGLAVRDVPSTISHQYEIKSTPSEMWREGEKESGEREGKGRESGGKGAGRTDQQDNPSTTPYPH